MRTVKDVADELRISIGAVYRLVANGELACHRFGKSIRISKQQLEDYLQLSICCDDEPSGLHRTLNHL